MLRVIKIATVAAFVQIVEGHVRAIPTGATGFGCRDCNGKASPGPFRVSGPLGGNKPFGANGVAKVTEGQEIELKIAYNGGHRSNTLNFFNVRYACGGAGGAANNQGTFNRAGSSNKDTINCNAPCKQLKSTDITSVDGAPATAANYPVDATASRRDGYTVKFKVPKIDGTGDARKCTFALVEGRNWGAGWDFDIAAAGAPPVPTPPPPPPTSVQGTYVFNAAGCANDAPGCKCLTGSLNVQHTAGADKAAGYVDIPGYPKQKIELTQKNPGAWSLRYILNSCANPDQELDITLAPDAAAGSTKSVLNVGVISKVPLVCGSIVKTNPTTSTFPVGPVTVQETCRKTATHHNSTTQSPLCPICAPNNNTRPNLRTAGCTDTAGWKDKDGLSCTAYSSCLKGEWRSKGLDHYKKFVVGDNPTARDACCRCGGGSTKLVATTAPPTTTPKPTTKPTKPVTVKPVGPVGPVTNPPRPVGPVTNPPDTPRPNPVNPPGVTTKRTRDRVFAAIDSAKEVGITFGFVMTVFAGMFV